MLQIEPIAAFNDNYIWVLHDGLQAWVVDPGDATPVLNWLAHRPLQLAGLLITHHHPDHIGGIAALRRHAPAAEVIGPDNPRIEGLTRRVDDGECVTLLDRHFDVIGVPGHTLDHLAYFSRDMNPPRLFCGDTLFAGGCGRLFEGSPAQMWHSLQRLMELPPETLIYCAHEYTLANLRFALAVEPDNAALQQRQVHDQRSREAGRPTLPSTLAQEQATNPFLRGGEAAVLAAARKRESDVCDSATAFAALRRWKDRSTSTRLPCS